MSAHNVFDYTSKFDLESGKYLPSFHMAYHCYGHLNEKKSNVIWIVHALTANSDPMEWWPGIVGPDCPIDTNRFYVVCANVLGSCYGSTSPLDKNPESGEVYFHDFPQLTVRDMARSYDLLRKHLGIDQIHLLIGASLGGQQCMEWSIAQPDVVKNMLLIATNAWHSPWGIAFNESQRMAIEADQTWQTKSEKAGQYGLKAARSIGLLSYRTSNGYNLTQEESQSKLDGFKASSYQQYQGEKLIRRFNAFSYWLMTKAMDSHDVGRGRLSREFALRSIKARTFIMGITTDILFPLKEQQYLSLHIPNSKLFTIHSELGHDGFLTESGQVGEIIVDILKKGGE